MRTLSRAAVAAVTVSLTLPIAVGAAAPRPRVPGSGPARQAHQLYRVDIGVETTHPALTIHKFLPIKLTIHAGDSVMWTNVTPKEPQTVTFSPLELVSPLITAANASEVSPQVVQPQGGHMVTDPSHNVYSSGALMNGIPGLHTSYTFTFPSPGIYLYRSLFHPTTIGSGEIDVVGPGKAVSVPGATGDHTRALMVAVQSAAAALTASEAQQDAAANGGGNINVAVGVGNDDVSINQFFPGGLTIKAGSTVTWMTNETAGDLHALVFSPDALEAAGAKRLYTGLAADGGLTINPDYATPSISATTVTTDTATHFTSGIIYGSAVNVQSKAPSSYSLTFDRVGTFSYADPFSGKGGKISVIQ